MTFAQISPVISLSECHNFGHVRVGRTLHSRLIDIPSQLLQPSPTVNFQLSSSVSPQKTLLDYCIWSQAGKLVLSETIPRTFTEPFALGMNSTVAPTYFARPPELHMSLEYMCATWNGSAYRSFFQSIGCEPVTLSAGSGGKFPQGSPAI